MKTRTLITAIAAATAVSLLTLTASAYDLDKDLKTGWSVSTTVPGDEFATLTADNYIKITYTADASLADMEGHSYWVIKPMINDEGWPLIEGIPELTPSEDGSSYVVSTEETEITFSIPADLIEHIQTAGIAFMGHGITLGTLTITDEAPAAPVQDVVAEAPVEDNSSDVSAAPADDKGNADTGIEGVAAIAGLGIIAVCAAAVSKRKSK